MATKKKGSKKVAKKKVVKREKPVVTQKRLQPIRDDLEIAQRLLTKAFKEAKRLNLADREDTARASQQINNALLRVDAAIDELST